MIAAGRDTAREDVKRALSDPLRVCEMLGLADGHKRQANGIVIRCPSHEDRNPSCSVQFTKGALLANCQACPFAGDVFDLVAAVHRLDVDRDFPRVLKIAADLAGIALDERAPGARPPLRAVPPPAPPPPVEDLTADWEALAPLDGDGWEYLRARGLDAAADLCRSATGNEPGLIGAKAREGWRLAQALRDAKGRVVAIQLRSFAEKAKDGPDARFRLVGPSGAGVFGDPLAVEKADAVVICEGFTDTLAASAAYRENTRRKVAVVGVAGVKAIGAALALPLDGKQVLVALDADDPGDEAAAKLTAELVKRKAIVKRARPTGGKDLADMLRAGEDLPDFFRRSWTGFGSIAVGVRHERAERIAMAGRGLRFGVKFLDAALGGMAYEDRILLGAKTNRGKTELATGIGRANASDGKRVHYIALEAGRYELERRIKYPTIARLVWEDRKANGYLCRRLNYLDWYGGLFDRELDKYEKAAEEEMARTLSTMFVRYKGDAKFDGESLARAIRDCGADGTDLVLCDHLHYIDERDGVPENRGLKEIMMRASDAQASINRPLVLVAHIRKADKKRVQLVPDIEEFHGSSDVAKIATKAIMIAPAFDKKACIEDVGDERERERLEKKGADANFGHLAMTYIEPAKCRQDGSRTRYVGLVAYNFRTGRYEPKFQLGRLDGTREKFLVEKYEKWPEWAKRADAERPSPAPSPQQSFGAQAMGGMPSPPPEAYEEEDA